jgi:23S rRNA (guanosine2251-2'-O)-methyltransferase
VATRSSPPDKEGKRRPGGPAGPAARGGSRPAGGDRAPGSGARGDGARSHQPGPGRAGSIRPLAPRRQYSDEYELYDDLSPGVDLIYGRNPVREALRGRRQVHVILIATGAAGDELEGALRGWCSAVDGTVPPVDRVAPGELSARLGTPDHQSIAAVVDPYPYLDPDEILAGHTLLVALDEVQDPHNLGAIIRTAEGAGAGVLIPRHRAAEVTGAVVKASAGATEHAAVARVRNLSDFLAGAKEAGFWIYGAAAGAESTYTSQDYTYPTCFVLGSEGEGLGRRVASLCDVMVGVPLAGRVESLNVSVSTGILLYEAVRQRTTGCQET